MSQTLDAEIRRVADLINAGRKVAVLVGQGAHSEAEEVRERGAHRGRRTALGTSRSPVGTLLRAHTGDVG